MTNWTLYSVAKSVFIQQVQTEATPKHPWRNFMAKCVQKSLDYIFNVYIFISIATARAWSWHLEKEVRNGS